ncbi:MAG TPA: FecR domain-containing protein [Terriglobia bacterium]|nr:FecR domain-containing protein [Terriglobia bacterium]
MMVPRTLGFLLLFAATANAQSIARLTGRIGTVEVQRGGVWIQAGLGEAIDSGERLRTAGASSASMELGTGKVITLAEGSEVEIGQSNGTSAVRLETGRIRVMSADDIQVSAKDTTLRVAEKPLDMELGYQADRLNLTVIAGAVSSGAIVIRGIENSNKRTYVSDSRRAGSSAGYSSAPAGQNSFYIYPYVCGNTGVTPAPR